MAKALSTYFDALLEYAIRGFFREYLPMNQAGLSDYADFFALGITLTFSSKNFVYLQISILISLITILCVHSQLR